METHTYHTFRILSTIGGMPQICEWGAFHHERLDGRGHPFGHAAAQLTRGARVMAVADVFTAIREARPYRPGMTREKARSVLDHQVQRGALDGEVVVALTRDYDATDNIRASEQSGYGHKQEQLFDMLGAFQATAMPPSGHGPWPRCFGRS